MSQSETLWSQSLDHDPKQDISKFIKADDKDRNESLRAIADFAKDGTQCYPITVNVGGGTVHFFTDSDEEPSELSALEAPAGALLIIVPKTSSGDAPSSGSMFAFATQGVNTGTFFDDKDCPIEHSVAMPIGGLTISGHIE